eukprot:TRINITY_DN2256_c0_g2_i1.p1 TRINITY_DN2256_c0_g2~~TRINITY_DN2256_c0_g2_i1.p1  ORF type:complete len:166 (-),score=35.37 TRINITY_DN2256_c0_g2_i1:517-1014(-)
MEFTLSLASSYKKLPSRPSSAKKLQGRLGAGTYMINPNANRVNDENFNRGSRDNSVTRLMSSSKKILKERTSFGQMNVPQSGMKPSTVKGSAFKRRTMDAFDSFSLNPIDEQLCKIGYDNPAPEPRAPQTESESQDNFNRPKSILGSLAFMKTRMCPHFPFVSLL